MQAESLKIIREEHATLATLLRSMERLIAQGPGPQPANYFEVLRAMLLYIDEFPERLHHPKETELLFPPVAERAPEAAATIAQLNRDHEQGERAVRDLLHQLVAWELLGEGRKAAFADAVDRYVAFYLEHMRLEETVVLPAAQRVLSPTDWAALDAAFARNCDPLGGRFAPDAAYDRLFSHIVMKAPAPVGLG